jgi:3'-phosphoadenosine 5'-phosphosulfate sulfotransferase (PAPS reductase)/FAD synthetase
MNILSLGAGVQSSTLAMMAAKGEIGPMPDAAIFADTGWEPKKVHEYLDWLEKQLPFPVYRVMKNDGLLEAIKGTVRFAAVPFFTSSGGMGRRQCTAEYKIMPVQKKVRELLGYEKYKRIPAGSVTMWIGISTDEAIRMKPSRVAWIEHRWPLIELGMSRGHCLEWFGKNNAPQPPKSSCLGCPFHSDKQWVEIKNQDAEE